MFLTLPQLLAADRSVSDPSRSVGGLLTVISHPKLQRRLKATLTGILGQYQSGDLSLQEAQRAVRKVLMRGYRDAYAAGKRTQNLTPKDIYFVQRIRDTEFEFLDGFFKDLEAGTGNMAYEQRLAMYANKTSSLYYSGMAAGKPRARFHWMLEPGDNCDSCIELSEGGPYLARKLPTVPGAGDTECLSNCHCYLLETA